MFEWGGVGRGGIQLKQIYAIVRVIVIGTSCVLGRSRGLQSISDSRSGFRCTVIVCHIGFFGYIAVDSGPLFAVSLYKTSVCNIALKGLPFH